MIVRLAFAVTLFTLIGVGSRAQATPLSGLSAAPASQPEFKKYFMVLLWAGPNRDGTPEEIDRIQQGHMANIQRLIQSKKMAIAGPFENGGELRGIFIMDVTSEAEAATLIATDPAIQAGRLRPEILAWWTERGRKLP